MSNDNTQDQAQSKQNLVPVEPARSGTGSGTSSGKMPSVDRLSGGPVQGTAVDPDTARKYIEGRQLPTDILDLSQPATSVAVKSFASGTASGLVGAPASIVELARGLKNDPDLIAEYVTTQVDLLPLNGLQKGGLGAALDQRGSAFDLADLMVQLLRQAGLTANFMFGDLRLTLAQAAARFGTSTTDIWAANNLLANGGIPVAVTNVSGTDYLDFSHCWIQVNIGGTFYVFDPSNKSYTTQAGIANLATAMGYNAATFLTSAKVGSTTTADYVQNMNRTNVRNNLTTMATSLVNWIKTNSPAASVDDIVGGKTINGITLGARLTSLPYQKPGSTPTVWTAIPAAYKATLGILYDTFNLTLNSADIYGKRLTMFFNASHQCELRLDGTVLATSSAQSPGSWNSVLLTATHPYPTTYADQSRWMRIYADQYYAIANGWGNASSRLRDIHTTQFYVNKATGAAATSETVLGEQLTAFYAAQNAENSRVTELVNKMTNCVTVFHHQLGLVGDVGAPMIDIAMFSGSSSALDNNYNRVEWNDTAGAIHGVMLEATAIQENTGPVGVSTVTIIDLATQAGKKIFDGKTANWLTSVKPNLVGWDPGVVTDIENYYINSGWRVALPENGVTTLNLFSGYGYWALPTYGAFGVLGGTKGGLGSNVRSSIPPMVPIDGTAAGAGALTLKSGTFAINAVDLTVGSSQPPYGISFARSYNAANAFVNNGLGLGWTHNFACTAQSSHSTLLSLADQSPIAGAASIVALFVATDLLSDLARPHDKFVTASLGAQWLADNVVNNVVSIVTASGTAQFVKLPDGSYVNPFRMADTLTLSAGAYTYKSPQKVTTVFNTNGTISSIVYPFGVTWTFTYTAGKLTAVSNGLGRQINLVYSGANLASINDGTGRSVVFTIDASNNLTVVKDPLNKNQTYSYVTPGLLWKSFAPANPASALFTNTYDSLGQLKQQADAYSNVIDMYYAGYRTETVDAAGKKLVNYLNRYGDVIKTVNHLGEITTSQLDARRRITQTTSPEGNSVQFSYDGNDNVLTTTAIKKPGSPLANLSVTRTYDPLWNKLKTYVDSLGRTTTYTYNATTSNLETVVHPTLSGGGGTPTINYTYNSRGQLLSTTGPTGIVVTSVYDATTEKLTSIINDAGVGRLNLTTNFGYNSVGDLTSVQDPRGNTVTYQFDLNRRRTQATAPAPLSYVSKFTYDDNGNQVKVEYQTNIVATPWQTFEATYAIDGKILTTKSPSGFITSFDYNSRRLLWKKTDALSRVTEIIYDDLGRMFTTKDPTGTISCTQTYTPNGKVASVKDARNFTTLYTYDGFDRPLRSTFPDGSYRETQSYNANSNPLVLRTRAGNTITMTYDELNRLKTKAPAGQPTVTYVHDLSDRLVSTSKPVVAGDPSSGTFTKLYDTAGRVTGEQYPDGKQFVQQLDANGNITRTTWPDAWYCERVFDQLNRMTDIKLNGSVSSAAVYQYDALSRRLKVTYENGTFTDYTAELDNDTSTIAHSFVGSNVTFSMGYNNNSEITSKQVSDSLFSWHPSSAGTLTYGTANNLNLYPTVGGTSYGYNNDGCLTSNGVWTYTYSSEGKLLTAVKTGTSLAFKYDPSGRQVEKSVGAVKTRFYYSGLQRMGDYSSAGVLQTRYVYAAPLDEVAIQISSAGVKTYLHADDLGSVIATTNSAGAIVNRYSYGPFGETTSLAGISNGYNGQRYDSDSGLYYYKTRNYSPTLGRFLQPDGIGYSAGFNMYAYVGNSPTNKTDTLGFDGGKVTDKYNFNWVRQNYDNTTDFWQWLDRIRPHGEWDIKDQYIDKDGNHLPGYDIAVYLGNYNFGYTGRKIIPRWILREGASGAQWAGQIGDWAQQIGGLKWPHWSRINPEWLFITSGDDWEDQDALEAGIRAAEMEQSLPVPSSVMGPGGLPTGPSDPVRGGGGGGSGPGSSTGTDTNVTGRDVSGSTTSRNVHGEVKNYKPSELGGDKATAGKLDPPADGRHGLTGRLIPTKGGGALGS